MGSIAPPFVEESQLFLDHIVSDGVQVTRPSIDPYREPVETSVYSSLSILIPCLSSAFRISFTSRFSSASSLSTISMSDGITGEGPLSLLINGSS
jgi:hypothetical protein